MDWNKVLLWKIYSLGKVRSLYEGAPLKSKILGQKGPNEMEWISYKKYMLLILHMQSNIAVGSKCKNVWSE